MAQASTDFKASAENGRYETARRLALQDFDKWVEKHRSRLVKESNETPLGPTMDFGTYFYRLGVGTYSNGFGMKPKSLEAHRAQLEALNWPKPINQEIRLINERHYGVLTNIRPNLKFVAKHFPGGDYTLEFTESQNVHFDSQYPIADWIDGFSNTIQGSKPAWGMMLSHASYDLHSFPDIQKLPTPQIVPQELEIAVRQAVAKRTGISENAPLIEIFSHVPASLNPFVAGYLRQIKNYKGAVVGDWYNMDSTKEFTFEIDLESLTDGTAETKPKIADIALLLGVNAGVGYMRGIETGNLNSLFWSNFQKNYPEQYASFDQKLNTMLAENYLNLKQKTDRDISVQDIEAMSFQTRIDMIFTNGASIPAKDYQNPAVSDMSLALLARSYVKENDLWNATGLMVMQYRKNFVERLSGQKFPDAPLYAHEEIAWFKGLMNNQQFRKIYDSVDWEATAKMPEKTVQNDPQPAAGLEKKSVLQTGA